MTEQKKPFPENKHETRLVTETRPPGVASSTFREEPGKSVDMIEIVGEKPRVVRIAQAAYDSLVRDGTDFFRNDYYTGVFHDPPVAPAVVGPWHVLAALRVPAGMAFDLTSLRYVILNQLTFAGGWDFAECLHDWAGWGIYAFRLTVDFVLPWTSFSEVPAIPFSFPGHFPLNEDWLAFGDCPVHIVAAEGQTVRFEVAQATTTNPTTLIDSGVIFARPRGRWIPIQHYKRIIGANSLE